MRPSASTLVDVSPGMTAYGFHRGSAEGGRHHFGPERFGCFAAEAARRGLWDRVREVTSGAASDDELELFHSTLFLMTLRECCKTNGVAIKNWNATSVNTETVVVSNNTYTLAPYAFYGYNIESISASVKSTTLVQSPATYTNNSNIYIDEINKPANASYTVNANNFAGTLNGVFARNAKNIRVINNTIKLLNLLQQVPTTLLYGSITLKTV